MSDPLVAVNRSLLRGLAERAPELAAVITIVGMFLFAQGRLAERQNEVATQAVMALQLVNDSLRANTAAMTVLAERGRAVEEDREREHRQILEALKR